VDYGAWQVVGESDAYGFHATGDGGLNACCTVFKYQAL
jgi:hypothetical protein